MQHTVGIITGLITLAILFRPFFNDKEDFIECVKFWFTPNILSAFRGKYSEDLWAELKLLVWLAMGFGAGYGTENFFS